MSLEGVGRQGTFERAPHEVRALGEVVQADIVGGEKAVAFTQLARMGELLRGTSRGCWASGSRSCTAAQARSGGGGSATGSRRVRVRRSSSSPRWRRGRPSARLVVHFDRWWNLAAEDQATDRAARVGEGVTVFELSVRGTAVEKRVLEGLARKRVLAGTLVRRGRG